MKKILSFLTPIALLVSSISANDDDLANPIQMFEIHAASHYILFGDIHLDGAVRDVSAGEVVIKLDTSKNFLELARLSVIDGASALSVVEYFTPHTDVKGSLAIFYGEEKISSFDLVILGDDGSAVKISGKNGVSKPIISQNSIGGKTGVSSSEDNSDGKISSREVPKLSTKNLEESVEVNLRRTSKTIYISGDYGDDRFSGRQRAISVSEGPKKTLDAALSEKEIETIVIDESSSPYMVIKNFKSNGGKITIIPSGRVQLIVPKREEKEILKEINNEN